jgi:hypothetical protein
MNNKPKYDLHQLPMAYFCDNNKSNQLRTELIKNQVRISEEAQGNLEHIFFSAENMELINKQLIISVFEKTKGAIKIPPQSSSDLIIVMRYVFLEYARHLPYDIMEQIRELNCRVVGEILPNIITNVNQRIDYLKQIENPRKILPLPQNVGNKNNKALPSVSTVLFGK